MRDKTTILKERMQKAYAEFYRIEEELRGYKASPPPADSCITCGAVFENMYDFNSHYLVDDERHLNLGNCPTRYNNGRLMPSLYGWGKSLEEYAYEEDKVRSNA